MTGPVAKHRLEDMTFEEFSQRRKDDPVILLPFGSQEIQGTCNPMGDFRLAGMIADLVAERTGALVAPTLPFGYADFFRDVPGSIQLSASTFQAVVEDYVRSLTETGSTRLLILNGHTQNSPLIEVALRSLRRSTGVAVPWINIWMTVTPETMKAAHGDAAKHAYGHGCDPLGSVFEVLMPGLTRRDRATAQGTGKTFLGMPTTGLAAGKVGEVPVQLPLNVHEHCDFVTSGDPALSNATAGRVILDKLVDDITAVVRHLQEQDPAAPTSPGPATGVS